LYAENGIRQHCHGVTSYRIETSNYLLGGELCRSVKRAGQGNTYILFPAITEIRGELGRLLMGPAAPAVARSVMRNITVTLHLADTAGEASRPVVSLAASAAYASPPGPHLPSDCRAGRSADLRPSGFHHLPQPRPCVRNKKQLSLRPTHRNPAALGQVDQSGCSRFQQSGRIRCHSTK
jgi:hypothetical protein